MTTSEVSVNAVDLREVRAELLSAGLGGRAFTRAYAEAVDEWLRPLFTVAFDGRDAHGVVLLAVGGYGRSELCPASDLDLVLVHERGKSVAGVAEAIWYPIWDAGFHLDHSVRTPRELVAMAAKDLKVALGLLTARPVAGDRALANRALDGGRTEWTSRRGGPDGHARPVGAGDGGRRRRPTHRVGGRGHLGPHRVLTLRPRAARRPRRGRRARHRAA